MIKIYIEGLSQEYRQKLCGRKLTKASIDSLASQISRQYFLRRRALRRAAVICAASTVLLAILTFFSPSIGNPKAIMLAFLSLGVMEGLILAGVHYAAVTRIPRQFAKCLEKGYPELEILYGYDRIVSGELTAWRGSRQLPFSMKIQNIFELEHSSHIVVTGFAHGLIAKDNSVFIIDKSNPARGRMAALVTRLEKSDQRPAAEAADCHVALELQNGKKLHLKEGMYLYREDSPQTNQFL